MARATPGARAVAILDALERHHPDADTELRLPHAVRAAGGDGAVGAVHRPARERGDAGAVRPLPDPGGAGGGRAGRRRGASSTPPASSGRRPRRSSACRRRWSPSTAARCRPTWPRWSRLPGVGRKTANVVLGHALGVPGLPVDRHVLRVAGRLGSHPHRRRGEGRGRSSRRCCRPSAGPGPPTPSSCTAGASAGRRRSVRSVTPGRSVRMPSPRAAVRARPAKTRATAPPPRSGARRRPGRAVARPRRAAGHAAGRRRATPMTRDRFRALVAEAIDSIPPRFADHVRNVADRDRGRAVGRTARRDGHRAARHAARPVPGHAADRAPVGPRQRPARPRAALPAADRRGRRGSTATSSA